MELNLGCVLGFCGLLILVHTPVLALRYIFLDDRSELFDGVFWPEVWLGDDGLAEGAVLWPGGVGGDLRDGSLNDFLCVIRVFC